MSDFRILVTGSRNYSRPELVATYLDHYTRHAIENGKRPVLVHGHCPTGADRFADEWAEGRNSAARSEVIRVERVPADWGRACDENCYHYAREDGRCPLAGHLRNAEMVSRGADVVLAFAEGDPISPGTRNCMKHARSAGLTVIDVTKTTRPDTEGTLFDV
ncbi:DprA-like DNA processing chain A [Rhodococcus phage Reynauld]|uniref:DprA-like DNA processing chain A n=1 Tax=Rhodococcus phage Reynauld TaxID=3062845 RepID=A0ACD4UJL5_9CAUD|nr:DprA-like DNA processing chain A [Rhodococcus phage Reynauld]